MGQKDIMAHNIIIHVFPSRNCIFTNCRLVSVVPSSCIHVYIAKCKFSPHSKTESAHLGDGAGCFDALGPSGHYIVCGMGVVPSSCIHVYSKV